MKDVRNSIVHEYIEDELTEIFEVLLTYTKVLLTYTKVLITIINRTLIYMEKAK